MVPAQLPFLRYLSNLLSGLPQAFRAQAEGGKLNYRPNKSHSEDPQAVIESKLYQIMTGADNITTPITKFASHQTAGRQKSNEGPNSITESLLGCCCRRVWPGTDLSPPPPPPPPEEILASSHPEPETWWGLLCRYRHCRLNIFPAVRPPEESNM